MQILNLKNKKQIEIHRVYILYAILSIFFVLQTIEFMNMVNYKKMIIDITMLNITGFLLVVVGYFAIERR